MSKKLNWDALYQPHGSRALPGQGQPKYRSGREFLQKGLEMEAEHKAQQEFLAKAQPALEALLKCRIEDRTPLKVVRPMQFQASDLVHQYEQHWDDQKGEFVNGEIQYSSFQDVIKSIPIGTELILKSLDPNLQEFIFVNQNGEEVVVPYTAKQALLLNTNVYEDTINFINEIGE